MHSKLIIIFCSFLLLGTSCKKMPGEGGNAQIKGTFWVRNYDPFFTIITGRYPAINQSVYLFFGDETSPGTSVKQMRMGNLNLNIYEKENIE